MTRETGPRPGSRADNAELAADAGALRRYREAVAGGDPDAVPVWAGEDMDLIHEVEAADAIVATLAADAESALALAQAG